MATVLDHRMRPVVLDTGAHAVPRGRAQTARAVLGVAIAAVLATGAIAAGGWSILTAIQSGTPASQPSPLWYATPPAGPAGCTADERC